MLEGPEPRPPAPPPSARGAPYGASEVTAENLLAVTEALRDLQDKISGATAAPLVAGEELRGRDSSGKSFHQQGRPGAAGSKSFQWRERPAAGAAGGERQQGQPGQ